MTLLARSKKGMMLISGTSADDDLLDTHTPKPVPLATENEWHGQKRQPDKSHLLLLLALSVC